ncbi:multicopper oxidase family protein [Nocardia sp. NPDC058058]|uniref:multicopper oxidase family protein n=1 Tax=Nocardia sp. NPDC058058 TaxID=3346317 RepID=UPI0036D8A507
MRDSNFPASPTTRRRFLALGGGLVAAGALAACSSGSSRNPVQPGSDAVAAAERRRRAASATIRDFTLSAEPATVDLGGVQVRTWTYGGCLPGQEIRLSRGEVLRAQVANALPAPTTVHWHGLALRNDMDGTPDITQPEIAAGGSFPYEFTVPDAGTYWFHPHVGVQQDRGLYAPLIVEDPADGRDYDLEAVVVLDDWLDGVDGRDPDRELRQLRDKGMAGMGGMSMDMPSDPNAPLGSDTGDVQYPYYLINGRLNTDPATFTARPGQRIRLRIINAAADTPFRVAVGGHRLRVTHTDGFPVQPVDAAAILIGMGERYDAIVELADGVFPFVAVPEGKSGQALALIRTAPGTPPPLDIRPAELTTPPMTADRLTAIDAVRLPDKAPDRILDLTLGSDPKRYLWTLNGRTYDTRTPLDVTEGERIRLRFINSTMMFHPMHLHGHTYQQRTPNTPGPRKDTSIVAPMQTLEVDFDATNPGQWMIHCHNAYHAEAGMMTVLSYIS